MSFAKMMAEKIAQQGDNQPKSHTVRNLAIGAGALLAGGAVAHRYGGTLARQATASRLRAARVSALDQARAAPIGSPARWRAAGAAAQLRRIEKTSPTVGQRFGALKDKATSLIDQAKTKYNTSTFALDRANRAQLAGSIKARDAARGAVHGDISRIVHNSEQGLRAAGIPTPDELGALANKPKKIGFGRRAAIGMGVGALALGGAAAGGAGARAHNPQDNSQPGLG